MKWFRFSSTFILTLLLIEFLDELVYGAREAAWPLMRDDLGLSYLQVGLVLGVPGIVGSLIEPFIGILGDIWKRRVLILGGGVIYALALILVASSQSFIWLIAAFMLLYPASGAFVSLSQAALMDAQPAHHEKNMARWTFAGSLGIVMGPLLLSGLTFLGLNWRVLFAAFALITLLFLGYAWRATMLTAHPVPTDETPPLTLAAFWDGVLAALRSLRRGEVLRWLILLQFSDLMLDVLHGYLALYFVDVAGMNPAQAALGLAIWTGAGLLSDFLLIPLLEHISGLRYLRISAWLILVIFPVFLLAENWALKLLLIGLIGILNAGWYAIPKGQLYAAMPGQSGAVMTLTNLFGLIGALIPLALGGLAFQFGLGRAIWLVLLGPAILLIGIPRFRSKIKLEA